MSAPDDYCYAEHLPPLMREIARLIGVGAVLKLSVRWGGVRLYVPLAENMSAAHPIACEIGLEAALKLAGAYGGEQGIDIARCVAAARAARNAEMLAQDASQRSLARRYGLSERQVRNIVRAARDAADEAQGGLF